MLLIAFEKTALLLVSCIFLYKSGDYKLMLVTIIEI